MNIKDIVFPSKKQTFDIEYRKYFEKLKHTVKYQTLKCKNFNTNEKNTDKLFYMNLKITLKIIKNNEYILKVFPLTFNTKYIASLTFPDLSENKPFPLTFPECINPETKRFKYSNLFLLIL